VHQNYAGHILSEEWQKLPNGTYRWVPEGSRPGHLRSQKANHYLDATVYAIAARKLPHSDRHRLGVLGEGVPY